jgi:hypothetical protein
MRWHARVQPAVTVALAGMIVAICAAGVQAEMVAKWNCNDLNDSAGTTNDMLTLGTGVTLANGELSFAAGSQVTVTKSSELTFSGSSSFTIWARLKNGGVSSDDYELLSDGDGSTGGFNFRLDGGSGLVRFRWLPVATNWSFTSTFLPPADTLHNVAATFQPGSSGNALLYYDGSSQTGTVQTTGGAGNSQYRIVFPLAGTLDELRVYNTALSVSELNAIVPDTNVPEPSSLVLLLGSAVSILAWRRVRRQPR